MLGQVVLGFELYRDEWAADASLKRCTCAARYLWALTLQELATDRNVTSSDLIKRWKLSANEAADVMRLFAQLQQNGVFFYNSSQRFVISPSARYLGPGFFHRQKTAYQLAA